MDTPELCEPVTDYLTRHGFAVRTAGSGTGLDIRLGQDGARLTTAMGLMASSGLFPVARMG